MPYEKFIDYMTGNMISNNFFERFGPDVNTPKLRTIDQLYRNKKFSKLSPGEKAKIPDIYLCHLCTVNMSEEQIKFYKNNSLPKIKSMCKEVGIYDLAIKKIINKKYKRNWVFFYTQNYTDSFKYFKFFVTKKENHHILQNQTDVLEIIECEFKKTQVRNDIDPLYSVFKQSIGINQDVEKSIKHYEDKLKRIVARNSDDYSCAIEKIVTSLKKIIEQSDKIINDDNVFKTKISIKNSVMELQNTFDYILEMNKELEQKDINNNPIYHRLLCIGDSLERFMYYFLYNIIYNSTNEIKISSRKL